jgi:choline kinase
MRAIVPAAGRGTRLGSHAAGRPKGLIPVGGRPILERTLEQLLNAGIEEVVCVTGYESEVLRPSLLAVPRRPDLRFIHNPDFATTNSIVSLSLSSLWWDEEFCVIDSDVCFSDELLMRLLGAGGDAMAIDRERAIEVIDMRVELRKGRVWDMQKTLPSERVAGEFFGLSRWTPTGAEVLGEEIETLLQGGEVGAWYEQAIAATSRRHRIEVVPASAHEWAEVDSPGDLQAAEAVVARPRASARRTR